MGLLRPYYVQLSSGDYIKYETDTSGFLNDRDIVAGPGFSKGWSDLEVAPGAYAKTALRFDYGSYNETISALEVGITGEYYTKDIALTVGAKPKKFFFNGYVAIIFGKRR